MMVLPTSIAQISDFNFKALLQFGSFIKNKLCIEGRKQLFRCFMYSLLFLVILLTILFNLFIALFLPLFDFSTVVFALIFIQSLVFEFLFDLSDLLFYFLTILRFFLFFWLWLGQLVRSHVIFFTIQMQPIVIELLIWKLSVLNNFFNFVWSQT